MSREHLYKAKRVNWMELPKEEWWVEGYYVKHGSRHWIYTGEIQYMYYPVCADLPTKYEVEEETVCEYTGLTDKNGRKIFENDILSFSQKGQIANGVVKMVDGCFFAIIECQKCWLSEGVKRYKGKIIGNIFDNPELLQNNQQFDD